MPNTPSSGRRWGRWALLGLALGSAIYFGFREKPQGEEPRLESVSKAPSPVPSAPPATPGAPCQVTGRVEGAQVVRVRIHSVRGQIDVDAGVVRAGRGFLATLPEQGPLEVIAMAEDGRTAFAKALCSGAGRIDVALRFAPAEEEGAVISGRCVYLDTGAPVESATIQGSAGTRHRSLSDPKWSGLTNEEGRFRIPVAPGTFFVACKKDGDAGDPVKIHVDPEGQASVELFVEARAGLAGVVVDEAGAPMAGVPVLAQSPVRPEPSVRGASDSEGRFLLLGLRPGATTGAGPPPGTIRRSPCGCEGRPSLYRSSAGPSPVGFGHLGPGERPRRAVCRCVGERFGRRPRSGPHSL